MSAEANFGKMYEAKADTKRLQMWKVYFIQSLKKKSYIYTGYTNNVKRRLKEHNSDDSKSATANYRPFELISYIAVNSKKLAMSLEKYFKTGSGRAFLRKHFLNF